MLSTGWVRNTAFAVCTGLALVPNELEAQRVTDTRAGLSAPSAVMARTYATSIPELRRGDRTYWKVGALITAVPAVIAANVMMDDSDDGIVVNIVKRVFGSAVLGAVFALPGALIGKQFPKD